MSSCIGGSLLSMDVKGEERCIITMTTFNGIQYYSESIPGVGEVRANIKDNTTTGNNGNTTTCSRILYNNGKPSISIVEGVGPSAVVDLLSRTTSKKALFFDACIITL